MRNIPLCYYAVSRSLQLMYFLSAEIICSFALHCIRRVESNRQTSQKRRKVYCYFYDMEAHHEEKEIRIRGRERTGKNVYDKGIFL